MKNLIPILLAVVVLSSGCEQELNVYNAVDTEISNYVLVGKWSRQPITGTVIGSCDVYSTRSKGSYKNGLKHGQWEQWGCKTGLLAVSANYKDGKRDGLYKAFWENGKLMEAGIYSNGTIHTSNAFYWESGELMQINLYDKGGNFLSSKCYKEDGNDFPCP